MDTDRGLLVPVIRNGPEEPHPDSHRAAPARAEARDRKLTLEEMSGGGITISIWAGSAARISRRSSTGLRSRSWASHEASSSRYGAHDASGQGSSSRIEASNNCLRAATASAAVASTTIVSSTGRTRCVSFAGLRKRSSSRSCCRSWDDSAVVADSSDRILMATDRTGCRARCRPRWIRGRVHAADLGMKVALIDEEKNRRLSLRMHSFEGSSSCSRGHR